MTSHLPETLAGAPKKRLAKRTRVLNVPPDVFDERDAMYVPRPVPLGACTPNREVPILDQGEEGACTGFALAATIHHQLARAGRLVQQVSPWFLYENAKKYDEWRGAEYEGSSIRGAMKGFWYHGACALEALPGADAVRRDHRLPAAAFDDANLRPLGAYFRIPSSSIHDLQSAIAEAGAVLASADVHAGWDEPRAAHGEFAQIEWKGQPVDGGHAFALVGFDERGFIVQNSWGKDWGSGGFAHLLYEDWLQHRQDTWVAQAGLGSVALRHPPRATNVTREGAIVRRVSDQQIRGHYISVRNGEWDAQGPLRSVAGDASELAESVVRFGKERNLARVPVVLYAHGGLVGEQAAAAKALEYKELFGARNIYAISILWHTGLMDELGDLLLRRQPKPRGPVSAGLRDRVDEALEALTRPLGRRLWRAMKRDALAAVGGPSGQALGPVAQLIATLAGPDLPIDLHLLGHSAGSILHAFLLQSCAAQGLRVASLGLLAPAIDTPLFAETVMPAFGKSVERAAVWTMSDADERDDDCLKVYGKSLLYLVSQAFEPKINTPLLGLARNIEKDHLGGVAERDQNVADWLVANGVAFNLCRPKRLDLAYHNSFEDDVNILDKWARWGPGVALQPG